MENVEDIELQTQVDGVSNKDTIMESIQDILESIASVDEEIGREAKGKDVVLVIGNTGAGKSTFVNYMIGKKMKETRKRSSLTKGVECEDDSAPAALIGHGSDSATDFPKLYSDDLNLTYCDCPGFLDSRGAKAELVNMYSIAKIANVANKVKGVVVIANSNILEVDRGRGLVVLTDLLHSILISRGVEYLDSMTLLMNRAPVGVTVDELRDCLSEVSSSQFPQNCDAKTVFDSLAGSCQFYDPLDKFDERCTTRQEIKDTVLRFGGIPSEAFDVHLSGEANSVLEAMLRRVLECAKQCFVDDCFEYVVNFVATMDELKILKSEVVDRVLEEFKQFMISKVRDWSEDPEMVVYIQKIACQIPLIGSEVEKTVGKMLGRIELEEDLSWYKEELKLAKQKYLSMMLATRPVAFGVPLLSIADDNPITVVGTYVPDGGANGPTNVVGTYVPDGGVNGPTNVVGTSVPDGGANGRTNVVGTYVSDGSANGRTLYRGPRGGIYYLTARGNKRYV